MMLKHKKKLNNTLELCQNYRKIPAGKWQTTGFNPLNQWFNNYVGVKPGYGLAPSLGYPKNIDNCLAVASWLDIKMNKTKWPIYSMAELRKIIKDVSPEHYFNS